MTSRVCRWRRDGRKTGLCSAVDGEDARKAEERRGDEGDVCVVVLMLRACRASSTAREKGHLLLNATICWKEEEKL